MFKKKKTGVPVRKVSYYLYYCKKCKKSFPGGSDVACCPYCGVKRLEEGELRYEKYCAACGKDYSNTEYKYCPIHVTELTAHTKQGKRYNVVKSGYYSYSSCALVW